MPTQRKRAETNADGVLCELQAQRNSARAAAASPTRRRALGRTLERMLQLRLLMNPESGPARVPSSRRRAKTYAQRVLRELKAQRGQIRAAEELLMRSRMLGRRHWGPIPLRYPRRRRRHPRSPTGRRTAALHRHRHAGLATLHNRVPVSSRCGLGRSARLRRCLLTRIMPPLPPPSSPSPQSSLPPPPPSPPPPPPSPQPNRLAAAKSKGQGGASPGKRAAFGRALRLRPVTQIGGTRPPRRRRRCAALRSSCRTALRRRQHAALRHRRRTALHRHQHATLATLRNRVPVSRVVVHRLLLAVPRRRRPGATVAVAVPVQPRCSAPRSALLSTGAR